MNKERKSVSALFKANKLSINIDKTKWTIVYPTSKKHSIPIKLLDLYTDGIAIERETVTKFLSVLMDENVTWKTNTDTFCTKISISICILYRARLRISIKQLTQLYILYAYSYLKYANLARSFTQKTNWFTLYCKRKHSIRLLSFYYL